MTAAGGGGASGRGVLWRHGGGARGWQFLKRNDHYAEACRALTDPAPAFLDAPFPIRRQDGTDLEAGPFGGFRAGRSRSPQTGRALRSGRWRR